MDYPVFGNLDAKEELRPELVLVIGSGVSALDIYSLRKRLEKFPSVGANYSYLLFISGNLVFLDWTMWSQDHYNLSKMDSQIFCPIVFPSEIVKNNPAPPMPDSFVRFNPYVCAMLGCKCRYDYLSNSLVKGLATTNSSILPAINLAYLSNPLAVAVIGIELDSRWHFWDDPRWPAIDKKINKKNDWSKLIWDYALGKVKQDKGKARSYFPNDVKVRRDIAKAGRFLKKKGIKAYNCAVNPPGALYGWDRIPLEAVLEEAEAIRVSRNSGNKRKKRKRVPVKA